MLLAGPVGSQWLPRTGPGATTDAAAESQFQAGWLSRDLTSPQQQLGQQLEDRLFSVRDPEPGPGGSIEADPPTANSNQLPNHANCDDDHGGKMHPPRARLQHQLQLQAASTSIRAPLGESQFLGQQGSSNGPPPVQPTSHVEGGGRPVKRVGTDTLHPPQAKRRITGKTGPRQN